MTVHGPGQLVRQERHGAIAVVRIDRPPLNLLNQDIRQQLGDCFGQLSSDSGVRALVLASGEANFCAGADMKEFPQRFDATLASEHWRRAFRMTLGLLQIDKPVVAAIEGTCLGGGFELALCCDIRVCGERARIGLPEIKRGVYPGSGGVLMLSNLIGPARAKRLIMAGSVSEAAQALAHGIVDEVVAEGRALSCALDIASELIEQSGAALGTIKRLCDADFLDRFIARADAEREAFVACYQTADAREGNGAFFERRAPVWQHA